METLPPERVVDSTQLSTPRAKALFALGVVFVPLTALFVAVRLYSRHIRGKRYGVDDALLVFALVFYYTMTVALYLMVFPAWDGHHTDQVPDPMEALRYSVKAGYYGTLSYALAATCIRCSTCVLFIRVFIQRSYRMAASVNLGFNVCWGIYSILVTIFQCTPVSKTFEPALPGHCLNQRTLLLSLTIWGVVCDAITWALPVPMVWQLQAPLSIKAGLTAILALGLVAIAIGALRIWSVVTISFVDPLWDLPLATYWAYTEAGIGIICAAAAAIAPAFERFFIGPCRRVYSSLRSWTLSRSEIEYSKNSRKNSQDTD